MQRNQTNLPDWSALVPVLVPVLPGEGPRARAVYAALRRLIEEGRLPAGAKLPPSRALAGQLGLARGAVVAGFEMLVADGFAEARVGAGTYVAAAVPRLVAPPPPPPAPFTAQNLPGDLGLAYPDPVSLTAFRSILNRQLARPPASLFREHFGLAGEFVLNVGNIEARKNQLVLAAYDSANKLTAASHVQAAKVLDDLYTKADNDADEASLGVIYEGGNITAKVWAPTARSVNLKVYNGPELYVPSAFTPNGDGLNDTFIPKMKGITEFDLLIFNLWGERIHESNGIESKGWDGTYKGQLLPAGNYIFKIEYTTWEGIKKSSNGSVSLIR